MVTGVDVEPAALFPMVEVHSRLEALVGLHECPEYILSRAAGPGQGASEDKNWWRWFISTNPSACL